MPELQKKWSAPEIAGLRKDLRECINGTANLISLPSRSRLDRFWCCRIRTGGVDCHHGLHSGCGFTARPLFLDFLGLGQTPGSETCWLQFATMMTPAAPPRRRYSPQLCPTPVFARPSGIGYDGRLQHQRDAAISEPTIDEQRVERERRVRRFVNASLSGRRPVNPSVIRLDR